MILGFNALSHFLVDAVCLATLFGAAKSGTDIAVAVLIYNTLACTTQCLTGWLVDRPGLARLLEAPSMLLVTAGYFLPGSLMLRVCLIGLGNSFFHVCGGRVTLEKSRGKAAPLGVFVAPGALGVAIGKCWPQLGAVLSVLLILMAGAVFLAYRKEPGELFEVEEKRRGPFPLLLLPSPLRCGRSAAVRRSFPGIPASLRQLRRLPSCLRERRQAASCATGPAR